MRPAQQDHPNAARCRLWGGMQYSAGGEPLGWCLSGSCHLGVLDSRVLRVLGGVRDYKARHAQRDHPDAARRGFRGSVQYSAGRAFPTFACCCYLTLYSSVE